MTYTHPITPYETPVLSREPVPNLDAVRRALKQIAGAKLLVEGVALTAYSSLSGEELSDLGMACDAIARGIAELERA